jgi:hypothetical protein
VLKKVKDATMGSNLAKAAQDDSSGNDDRRVYLWVPRPPVDAMLPRQPPGMNDQRQKEPVLDES